MNENVNEVKVYCMRCGSEVPLDFRRYFKKARCQGCGLEFRYREKDPSVLQFSIDTVKYPDMCLLAESGTC